MSPGNSTEQKCTCGNRSSFVEHEKIVSGGNRVGEQESPATGEGVLRHDSNVREENHEQRHRADPLTKINNDQF